ncbi:aldehyde dehydrogenase family protein [Sporolactobacillus terrae]|uniref:Aldehyde dehydrogenase n=1 Tax=Sporolactobacillus terrae TaxID=269673 RepID=A0A410DCQ6_9BACL|nr:aldehyde dehydrogenase family protein [Sporolactobacillus terrae]QAA23801.1 aldehyde dehydrogenase [Sporolactobacillus terrae]QAA26772.1 aldehyde dehydrogenase [Sporolactobacillus terrae]BBO00342.1 aldehyde dehydrogenase [Sporolactobacillus terrae]
MSIQDTVLEHAVDSEYKLYIGGKWVTGTEGKKIASYNPSNGEKLTEFVDASHADVDAAVEAATKAFETWKDTSVQEKSAILLKIADLIDENTEHLALVETLDNGKPLRETTNIDVPASADHFRYFAGVIRSEEGTANALDENTLTINLKEPLGVVGQVIPWNFPLLMAAWKIAPAIAAGNTVVIHPSSSTSLSLLELAKLLDQALPAGVVNVITGRGSDSGDYMLHHEGFAKLAFTGSTQIGYEVAEAAAKRLIPATLELGGKSANIFFDDAPWERAIEGAQLGILFNQGQVCCAGSRIFIQEGIYDKFVAALKEAFEKVKVGLPWEDGVQMGAQVNKHQLSQILDYVKIGQDEGAKLVTGGCQLTDNNLDKGVFMAPTLLADAKNTMRIAQEEIFGPVATVIKFKDADEVIKLANESDYGLGGAVWTKDINKALRVARGVRTGRMWVNTYNQLPAGAPFGGYKKSGIGRETYKSILDAYTQTKNIYISTKEDVDGLY